MPEAGPRTPAEAAPSLKLLRVLGPPGSGKTLLITTLVEEFRTLGHFVATSAPRGDGDATSMVITTSSGARITASRLLPAEELCRLVASIDPRATLLLAESLEATSHPAIEVVPPGAQPSTPPPDLLATIPPSEVAPGATAPLAALIASRLLTPAPSGASRSFLSRLLRGR
jgi:hypothetical protein